ncbi:MAG: biotin--[acetyl-CoA-carboxylase] ligase [Bacteriovoracaceae bacterium]
MIRHIHLDHCDSTQDVLKEQLSLNNGENLLISCDHQTSGRGRGDHKWTPMPGSLYMSFTVAPSIVPSFTAIELSVLVADFFDGSKLTLKWPNDIFNHHYKKCAGILIQQSQNQMLAGIGINLFSSVEHFGGVFEQNFECNKKSWCWELAKFINENRFKSIQSLKEKWMEKCHHLGDHVMVVDGNEKVHGYFRGLGDYGEALIENNEGIHKVYNGSLRFFNPDLQELY